MNHVKFTPKKHKSTTALDRISELLHFSYLLITNYYQLIILILIDHTTFYRKWHRAMKYVSYRCQINIFIQLHSMVKLQMINQIELRSCEKTETKMPGLLLNWENSEKYDCNLHWLQVNDYIQQVKTINWKRKKHIIKFSIQKIASTIKGIQMNFHYQKIRIRIL